MPTVALSKNAIVQISAIDTAAFQCIRLAEDVDQVPRKKRLHDIGHDQSSDILPSSFGGRSGDVGRADDRAYYGGRSGMFKPETRPTENAARAWLSIASLQV
jgi:hypothetical protein